MPGSAPGSTSAPRTSCACRRPSSPTRRSPTRCAPLRGRGYASPTTARGSGTGSRCCRGSGSTTSSAACPASRASRPGCCRRTPARSPPPARACASPRSTSPTAARPRTRTTSTSSTGSPRCARSVTDPATAIVAGDMNIAPTDDDVWDPALFSRLPTSRRPSARRSPSYSTGPARRRARPLARLPRVHLLGLPRRPLHQDLGMRIDLVLAGRRPCRADEGGVDRPAGAQGQGPQRPRAGDRRPGHAPDGDLGPVVPPPSAPVPLRWPPLGLAELFTLAAGLRLGGAGVEPPLPIASPFGAAEGRSSPIRRRPDRCPAPPLSSDRVSCCAARRRRRPY